MTRLLGRCLVFLLAGMGLGCESASTDNAPSVEIGIFYGGQIRRAQEIQVSLVRPPKLGFRVHVPETGDSDSFVEREVIFELVRPGPVGRRVTKKGKFSIPQGATQVDHVFELEPPLRLGLWNVRVLSGEQLLADRALYLKPKVAGSP